MKPEIKKLWVDALRSGDYKQGQKVLHHTKNNSFCCLGVLCDLAVKNGVKINIKENSVTSYDGEYETLPEKVIEWSELLDQSPDSNDPLITLAGLNDIEYTFDQIADIIEKVY